MTKTQFDQLVGWRLGDRDDMADRINAELDYIQDYVLESNPWLPWFLESEMASADTTPHEARLPIPQDFLSEVEESHLFLLVDGEKIPLRKGTADRLSVAFPAEGRPVAYALVNEYFVLSPTPDAEYPVTMRYYAKDARLSTSFDTSRWAKHAIDVVINELLAILAGKHIKDQGAAAAFAAEAKEAWGRLYVTHTARMEVNQVRLMGGET
jgi:hypothetical protein